MNSVSQFFSHHFEKDLHEFDDSSVDWIEANINSIITNKDDDMANSQKTKRQKVYNALPKISICSDENDNAYFNNVLYDNERFFENENKRESLAPTLHNVKRIFSPEKMGPARTPPGYAKATDPKYIYDDKVSLAHVDNDYNGYTDESKEPIVLHVKNLDYKINSDEWQRILRDTLNKHCKKVISVNIITNADRSLLGIIKLGNKDDVKQAITNLHHKKIGYKRLNVNIVFSPNSNCLRSKIISILASNQSSQMVLTKFMEVFELRYGKAITISELFDLKDCVHVIQGKDGQGRVIRLASTAQQGIENEIKDLMHTPYCFLHSSASNVNNRTWLPNVIVSLRHFKPSVHKLLHDHGGKIPLTSFLNCYGACILSEPVVHYNFKRTASTRDMVVDDDNGLPLEHLLTCAQDVVIKSSRGQQFKQLEWDNDKSRTNIACLANKVNPLSKTSEFSMVELDNTAVDANSQRKINQFCHEAMELLKAQPRCMLAQAKFSFEYYKKYGRQCRIADFGHTKLIDLLESVSHVIQLFDGKSDKMLTLTHRIQVKRFSYDLVKVLKAHGSKQMFSDEYPVAYETHFKKKFDIRDYGVCYLEDMLAELPDTVVSRKEINMRTVIQVPQVVQDDEEIRCTGRLSTDIVDMLRDKTRFAVQFAKFIPVFHHHFGRQCKLSNYGFAKLIELVDAMPNTVRLFTNDIGIQFVQLTKVIMLDLVCENLVQLLESNNNKLQLNLTLLEDMYRNRFEPLVYADFDCTNMAELFDMLPLRKCFIDKRYMCSSALLSMDYYEKPGHTPLRYDIVLMVEPLDKHKIKRSCKLALRRLFDETEVALMLHLSQQSALNNRVPYTDILRFLFDADDLTWACQLNRRSLGFQIRLLSDFFTFDADENVTGLSDIYDFGKSVRNMFVRRKSFDMGIETLEAMCKQETTIFEHVTVRENINYFKKLGFVDVNVLFSQGVNLIVTMGREKRIILNQEFWPRTVLSSTLNKDAAPFEINSRRAFV